MVTIIETDRSIDTCEINQDKPKIIDLLTPYGIIYFSEQAELQNWKSLLLFVHPFFNLIFGSDGSTSEENQGYLNAGRRIFQHDINDKLPVLILVESRPKDQYVSYNDKVNNALIRLENNLSNYFDIQKGQIFAVVTHRRNPTPLIDPIFLKDLLSGNNFSVSDLPGKVKPFCKEEKGLLMLINYLKQVGINRVVVGGRNLIPGNYDISLGNRFWCWLTNSWTLRKNVEKRRWEKYGADYQKMPKHPFELVSLEECVGFVVELLEYCGLHAGISSATGPWSLQEELKIRKNKNH